MQRSAASEPDQHPDAPSGRILVCEDDPLLGMGLAAALREGGYLVAGPHRTAEDALVDAYRNRPDLALVDIGLKGAVDGISLAGELAPLGVPVVLLTGDYARAAAEGRDVAVEVLIKPVTAEVLLAAVGDVAERRGRDG